MKQKSARICFNAVREPLSPEVNVLHHTEEGYLDERQIRLTPNGMF